MLRDKTNFFFFFGLFDSSPLISGIIDQMECAQRHKWVTISQTTTTTNVFAALFFVVHKFPCCILFSGCNCVQCRTRVLIHCKGNVISPNTTINMQVILV